MSKLRTLSSSLLGIGSLLAGLLATAVLVFVNLWDPLKNSPDPNMSALGVVAMIWFIISLIALCGSLLGLLMAGAALILKTERRALAAVGLVTNVVILFWAAIGFLLGR